MMRKSSLFFVGLLTQMLGCYASCSRYNNNCNSCKRATQPGTFYGSNPCLYCTASGDCDTKGLSCGFNGMSGSIPAIDVYWVGEGEPYGCPADTCSYANDGGEMSRLHMPTKVGIMKFLIRFLSCRLRRAVMLHCRDGLLGLWLLQHGTSSSDRR